MDEQTLRRRAAEIAMRLVDQELARLAQEPLEAAPAPAANHPDNPPDEPEQPEMPKEARHGSARAKCPECGKVVKPKANGGPAKVYCSDQCRQRVYQRDRRARLKAEGERSPPDPDPEPEPQPHDARVTAMLADLAKLPAETSSFNPRVADDPHVPVYPSRSSSARYE